MKPSYVAVLCILLPLIAALFGVWWAVARRRK